MKEFLKTWVPRLIILGLLAYAGKTWGVPLYKQYFTHEKQEAFIPTSEVRKGPFTVSFHEMGTLDAEKSEQVLNSVEGKIIWLVKDGINVRKGDKICELDVNPLKTQMNSSRLANETAKSNIGRTKEAIRMYKKQRENDLEKAKEDYKFAEEQLDLMKTQLEKKRALAKDKLISGQEIIQTEMDVKSKEMDLKKRKMDLNLLEEQVKSDIKLKERDVEEAVVAAKTRQTELEDIEKKMKQATVFAKADGLVVLTEHWRGNGQGKVEEGDSLYPNQPICTLPDLSHMRVKVNLGEADAPRVQIGMQTLMRLDSIPNRVFHGTVKTIDSLAKTDEFWRGGNGQKKIEVIVEMKEADPKILKPGMTADVEFISKQVAKTLYVPIESVVEKDGKTVVFLREGKSFRRVPVKTGIANDNFISIKEGLKDGSIVALRDPSRPLESQEPSITDASEKKSAPMPKIGK